MYASCILGNYSQNLNKETGMSLIRAKSVVDFLLSHRKVILGGVFLITCILGYGITKIEIDNDTMKSVPDDLHEKIEYEILQEKFPSPFSLLFMAKFSEDTDLKQVIDSLYSWEDIFLAKKTDSGSSAVSDLMHLGKLQVPEKGGFFGLKGSSLIPDNYKKLPDRDLKARIESNTEFSSNLISENQRVAIMVLHINPEVNRPDAIGRILETTNRIDASEGIETYITGATASSYFIDKFMKKDFSILLPFTILVASILLWFIFRRIMYVFASLFFIAVALIWTFGIMGYAGIPFVVVTSVIPVILFPIGVADSIHVLKRYSHYRWEENKDLAESLTRTYRELLRPIILTSITTFIGFGSFIFSSLSWTRTFGIFTGIAVMFSLCFTITLLPAILHYEKAPKNKNKRHTSITLFTPGIQQKYRYLIFNTRFWIYLGIITIILCAYGVSKVRFESNPITLFSDESQVKKSDKIIDKYFNGTRFFSVLLTHEDKEIASPELWEEIDSITTYIKSFESVERVNSLLPLVKKTSYILSDKPFSRPGLKLIFSSSGFMGKEFSNLLEANVADSGRTIKLKLSCKNIPGYRYSTLADSIENHIESHMEDATGGGWEVMATGEATLIDSMIYLLIRTQTSSVLIAFLSVWLILSLLFKSIRIGFRAVLPIILSTISTYALMGILNVPINTVTVVIVNTCIGIGIDYSIHFTAGFLYLRKMFTNNIDALIHTVEERGSVIIFNTVVVGAGFLVLIGSNFPPIRHFGIFIFISMFTSTVFSLIFLPVFFQNYTQDKEQVKRENKSIKEKTKES